MRLMSKKPVLTVAGILALIFGVLVLSFAGGQRAQVLAEETTTEAEGSEGTVLYSGTSGDLDWSISSDGVLTIEGSGDYAQDHSGITVSGLGSSVSYPEWICYKDEIKSAVVSVSNITNMQCMFLWCPNLTTVDFGETDTSKVTDMKYMFLWCSSLTDVDFTGFDTSNVLDMSYMFWRCSSLKKLDLSSFDTSKVTSMLYMFSSCESLIELDGSIDTANVRDMACMFYQCSALTSLDLSGFDTSNARFFTSMFYNCSKLTELDVSGFDTSNATSMSFMFYSCSGLTELDVSGFDTSNVTNMSYMFYECSGLTELDVSGFDTSSVTNMAWMFYKCSKVTHLDVRAFDTSDTTTFAHMFRECSSLTELDVSGFDTTNVTSMNGMFYGCESLTGLNMSGFDFSGLESSNSVWNMLTNCTNLETVSVSSEVPYEITLPAVDGYQWCDASGNIVTEIEKESGEAMTYTRCKIAVITDFSKDGVLTLPAASYTYTGSAIRPAVTVSYNSITLTEGTDYTVAYSDNINVGTATVTVTGTGDYEGTLTAAFAITAQSISSYKMTLEATTYTYDGTAKQPAVTVKSTDGKTTLTGGTDYTIVYTNNTNVGTATVTATGTGNYTGTLTAAFTITAQSIVSCKISLGTSTYTYDGIAKQPTVTVKSADGAVTLTGGTDYTVAYSNNTNAGTATVTVTGTGKYSGTQTATFTIKKAGQTVTVSAGSTTLYVGGSTAKVTASATGGGKISFSSANTAVATVNSSTGVITAVAPGTVTITATAAATTNYNSAKKTVTIKVSLASCSVSYINNTMDGLKVVWGKVEGASGYYIYRKSSGGSYSSTPTKVVTGGSTTSWTDPEVLTGGKDYTYKVAAYYKESSGNVTVYASGTTKTCKYLKGGEVTDVTNTSSGVKVTWAKVTGANGYQIFRKASGGDYVQVKEISGGGTVSWTDTASLSSGKDYTYKVSPIFTNSSGQVTKGGAKTTKTIKYLSPGEVTGLTNESNGITVKWNKVTGATGYTIYRKAGRGSYSQVKTITGASTTSWSDTSAHTSGTNYSYKVEPYFRSSAGVTTAAGVKTTKTIKYLSPGEIETLANSTNGITVQWKKVTGASGYYIYRKSGSGSYTQVKAVTSGSTTGYTDTAVKNNNTTSYTYYVRPYYKNSSGVVTDGAYKVEKTTVRLTSTSISSLKNAASKKLTITWSKVSGVTGYQIQYAASQSFGNDAKTVTITSASTTSQTVTGMVKNKTYYVRIRTYYTTSSGVPYYSAWSSAVSVKITK